MDPSKHLIRGIDIATGEEREYTPEQAQAGYLDQSVGLYDDEQLQVAMDDDGGDQPIVTGTVSTADLREALSGGFRLATRHDMLLREAMDHGVQAKAEGLLQGFTGVSDLAARGLGVDMEAYQARRETGGKGAETLGSVLGVAASVAGGALVRGGATLGAKALGAAISPLAAASEGLAVRGAASLATKGVGAVASKALAYGATGAVEGAITGGLGGASAVSMANPDMDGELMWQGMLGGAKVGAAFGAVAGVASGAVDGTFSANSAAHRARGIDVDGSPVQLARSTQATLARERKLAYEEVLNDPRLVSLQLDEADTSWVGKAAEALSGLGGSAPETVRKAHTKAAQAVYAEGEHATTQVASRLAAAVEGIDDVRRGTDELISDTSRLEIVRNAISPESAESALYNTAATLNQTRTAVNEVVDNAALLGISPKQANTMREMVDGLENDIFKRAGVEREVIDMIPDANGNLTPKKYTRTLVDLAELVESTPELGRAAYGGLDRIRLRLTKLSKNKNATVAEAFRKPAALIDEAMGDEQAWGAAGKLNRAMSGHADAVKGRMASFDHAVGARDEAGKINLQKLENYVGRKVHTDTDTALEELRGAVSVQQTILDDILAAGPSGPVATRVRELQASLAAQATELAGTTRPLTKRVAGWNLIKQMKRDKALSRSGSRNAEGFAAGAVLGSFGADGATMALGNSGINLAADPARLAVGRQRIGQAIKAVGDHIDTQFTAMVKGARPHAWTHAANAFSGAHTRFETARDYAGRVEAFEAAVQDVTAGAGAMGADTRGNDLRRQFPGYEEAVTVAEQRATQATELLMARIPKPARSGGGLLRRKAMYTEAAMRRFMQAGKMVHDPTYIMQRAHDQGYLDLEGQEILGTLYPKLPAYLADKLSTTETEDMSYRSERVIKSIISLGGDNEDASRIAKKQAILAAAQPQQQGGGAPTGAAPGTVDSLSAADTLLQ